MEVLLGKYGKNDKFAILRVRTHVLKWQIWCYRLYFQHTMFFSKYRNRKRQTKRGSLKEWVTKNEVTNAEFVWCVKVVDRYFRHNSCSDLVDLLQCVFLHFQCVFLDKELFLKFQLGKPKYLIIILCGIAPNFNLIKWIIHQHFSLYHLTRD